MNPKIGIVTVLYNGEKHLDDFFTSLNRQDYTNIVLYVIDNNSSDNSLGLSKQLAQKVFFRTFFIVSKENGGVAKGNNWGIQAALKDGCDMVLLSNNDTVLYPNTISSLLEDKQKHNAPLAVPKIYSFDESKLWFAGGRFYHYKGSTRHFGEGESDHGQFDIAKQIDYAPTCFILIDKNVFTIVGLMDEKYFAYYDDTDFVYRCNMKNQKLFYLPSSKLIHKEGASSGGQKSYFSLYYSSRNCIYFSLKHYSLIHNVFIWIYRLSLILFKKIFTDKFSTIKTMLKGHMAGFKLYYSNKS